MQAPRSRGNETTQLHEVAHRDGVEPPARGPIREGDTPQTPSPLPLQTGTQNNRGDGGDGKDSRRRPAKVTER